MDINWSIWRDFPKAGEINEFIVSSEVGIYQLRIKKSEEYINVGMSKELSKRMKTLLPPPEGKGGRKNINLRKYIGENRDYLEYRTASATNVRIAKEMKKIAQFKYVHKY